MTHSGESEAMTDNVYADVAGVSVSTTHSDKNKSATGEA